MQTYTVKQGDSLSKISEMFYGNWSGVDTIAKANGITNVNLIHPGQTLSIPPRPGASNSDAEVVEDAVVIPEGEPTLLYKLIGGKRWMWWLLAAAAAGGYYYHRKYGKKKGATKPKLNGTKRKKRKK